MQTLDLAQPRRTAFAIGYRMLGTVHDAEDIAQEAITRLSQSGGAIENADAWVTTVATRLSIDVLRSARVRRESYVGPWLPEPLMEDPAAGPDDHAERMDSISQALLVALERLTPVERAAFLLREVFGYDYARIGEIIERTDVNARQLVARAKKHVEAGQSRFDTDPVAHERLFARFLDAVDGGELAGLEALLAEDVVLWGDGGGNVISALRPVRGRADVARFLVHTSRWRRTHGIEIVSEIVTVNGGPGQVMRQADGSVFAVVSVDVVEGRFATLRMMRNPAKLGHVAAGPPRS